MNSKTLKKVLVVILAVIVMFAIFTIKAQAATTEDVAPIIYDAEYYITTSKDLQDSYIREDGSVDEAGLYGQFVVYGIAEGRKGSPSFDIKYYMKANPDLVTEFGAKNYARGYQHFLEFGLYEGRTGCNLYDNACYKAENPDLVKAYKDANEMYYVHFVLFGQGEGRKACDLFDVKCYVNSNADLKKEFGTNWKAGYKHYAFFGCNENRILAHTWEDVNTEATCEAEGKVGKVCKTCGEGKIEVAPAQGHKYEVQEEDPKAKLATCLEAGLKVEVCSVCGDRKETELPILPHEYIEADDEALQTIGLTKVTCDTEGYTAKVCKNGCGNLIDVKKLNALGHEYGAWVVMTEADREKYEDEDGAEMHICARCQKVETRNLVEAAKDSEDNNIIFESDAVAESANIEVPKGKTLTIKGKIDTSTATITVAEEAKLVLDAVPTEGVTLEGEGVIELQTADSKVLGEAVARDGITDVTLTDDIVIDNTEKLADDLTSENRIVKVGEGKEKVLNLNEHKLSCSSEDTNILISANGILNINGGELEFTELNTKGAISIDGTLNMNGVKMSSNGTSISVFDGGKTMIKNCQISGKERGINVNDGTNSATITVEDSEIVSDAIALAIYGRSQGVTIVANGSTFKSNEITAVYLPSKGSKATFTDCTIEGATGVEVAAGTLELKGKTTVTATKAELMEELKYPEGQTDGVYCDGSAILLLSKPGYSAVDENIALNIASTVTLNSTSETFVRIYKVEDGGAKNFQISGVATDVIESKHAEGLTINGTAIEVQE